MSIFTGKCDLADSIRDLSLHGLLEFARKNDIFEYTPVHVGKRNVEAYAGRISSLPTFVRKIRIEWTKRGFVRKAFAVMSDEEFPIDLTGKDKETTLRIIRKVDGSAPSEVVRRLRRIIGMASWGNGNGENGFALLTSSDYTDTADRANLEFGGERRVMQAFEEQAYQRYLWSILPWTLAYEQSPSSIFRFYTKIETTDTYVLTFEDGKRGYRNFDIQAIVDFNSSFDRDDMEEGLIEMSGRSLEEVSAFLGVMGDDGRIIFEPETAKEILRNGLHKEDRGGGRKE